MDTEDPKTGLTTGSRPSTTHLVHRVIGRASLHLLQHVHVVPFAVPAAGVMGLHKLTAGDGYTYLTRQVAAHDSTENGSVSLGDYYAEKGESPGQWLGAGLDGLGIAAGAPVTEPQMKSLFGFGRHPNADRLAGAVASAGGSNGAALAVGALGRPFNVYVGSSRFQVQVAREFTSHNTYRGLPWNAAIAVEERAAIRTAVATRMFTQQHGRPPEDARELSGFIARASRQTTTAVAGYDLTFSPVKSVSTLWALAPVEVSEQIRRAHDAAVKDTIGWLEREVAFTRVGRAGARQVAVRGLVAAAFTHRDSRAGDPDLHTHVAVSNKVQTLNADGAGRWLALDGRVLYRAKVAASERYNTRLEAELVARLGVRFADREATSGKRPVREIEGVNPLLSRWWSRRRREIDVRRADLAADFQARHGRPPTAVEALGLAQQATLETREGRHAPRSEAAQRAGWRREASEILGGGYEVTEMVRDALRRRPAILRLTDSWVTDCATRVIAVMEESRATWRVWHVRAEAERQARAAGIGLKDLDNAVDRVVRHALNELSVRLGKPDPVSEPAALRRTTGESVYDVHGATSYTSARVLAAEQRLLDVARATDGRKVSDARVGIAIAEEAANRIELNEAQAAMVRDLATSGRRLQLALAPAGTGKTTAMRVLDRAWTEAGGCVLGLAPSAGAAQELGRAVDGHTDTLAKLTWTLGNASCDEWPVWVSGVGSRTLVIIDEAGQAGTAELATAVDFITGRGGTVRLVGDDQQLASVGAGGVLRDIQQTGGAATLSEVRRFHDHAEAAATLAVRAGDASALGFYADNGRIHVGDIGSVADQAYAAWAADRRVGLDSILLAPTRELVTQLNARARRDRLDSRLDVAQVGLADGTQASAGDTIVTRRNERRLTVSASDWVKNGDRWAVEAVNPDGSLSVRHLRHRRSVILPAAYVAEQVQLGYAVTVHSAQGMTTDTAHVVVSGEEARQLLYVAVSRGRIANHIYLANTHDGDPHSLIRAETLLPPTAIDVLTHILDRDGSHHSATTTRRELDSSAVQLHQAATRYHDALGFAAEQTLGTDTLTALDQQIEAICPGVTAEPAYPTLRGNLALHALDGTDPLALVVDAAASRELGTADDMAAVLGWRIGKSHGHGPLPWLAAVPAALQSELDWGPYLTARAARVSRLAEQVRAGAHAWTPTQTPAWAAPLTAGANAELRGDIAVWRAAFAVSDTDTRTTGPRQRAIEAASHQRQLDNRARHATGSRRSSLASTAWHELIPDCVNADPSSGVLRERLESLTRAGVSIQELLTSALAEPRPLPDEHTSDALWWRVVRHLGPAALRASGDSGAILRPAWTRTLVGCLGSAAAERVIADPGWPALVAAVHARPAEWTVEELLSAATAERGSPVPVEELCSALVWRVATLTDVPDDPDTVESAPPDPLDLQTGPPDALDLLDQPEPFSAPTGASTARIVELNRAALDYYAEMYPRSWAPDYLRERLGADLAGEPRFTVGYAPPGPTSLIRHLAERGADEQEFLDAGLARRTDRGHLVDAFRDRLVFPIYNGPELVGFIGRRNPTKDHSEYAGPKYLNTKATAAFTKGKQLFGLSEGAEALAAGAAPVLVEGPLDAIAVTVSTDGRAVGIAPLGTAFTHHQAEQLRRYFREDPSRIVIATDPDTAGWKSAQRAFWQLARHGADPRHLTLSEGLDPADLLRFQGRRAVAVSFSRATPIAQALIDSLLDDHRPELGAPAARLRVVRQTGRIIGALPPQSWLTHIEHITNELGLPPGMLHLEVADAGAAWTNDPAAQAARRLAELNRTASADWSSSWTPPAAANAHEGSVPPPPPVAAPPADPRRPGQSVPVSTVDSGPRR